MRARPVGGGRRDDAAVEVEMVDVYVELDGTVHLDGLPADGVASEEAPTRGPEPWYRRRWLPWAAVGAVLVLVLAANVLEVRRDQARRDVFAGHPSVAADLSQPLEERWRMPAGWVMATAADLIVVETIESLSGVDPETGEVRWELVYDLSGPGHQWCIQSQQASRGPGQDQGLPDAADLVLVCLFSGTSSDDGALAPDVPESSARVIDLATGQVQQTLAMGPGETYTVEWVDDDLVVLSYAQDDHVSIERWDLTTGELVWQRLSEAPVLDESGGWSSERVDDIYTVHGASTLSVDLRTGQSVAPSSGDTPGQSFEQRDVLPDGRVAVWTYPGPDDLGFGTGHVEDADGEVQFEVSGPVSRAMLDDGSAPDVLLVATNGYGVREAIDAQDGRSLWKLDSVADGYPMVQVEGIVVLGGGSTTQAIDVRDGSLVWTVETSGSVFGSTVTDGVAVVLPINTDDGPALAAHDLRSGTELWRVPVPASTHQLQMLPGGHIAVHTQEHLIGLG